MLSAFKNFQDPSSDLYARGIKPTYPATFRDDVLNDRLPAVSWIIPSLLNCEHPALPPAFGARGIVQVLDILTANPAVWEKTALIISYDENGGFFDHVPPPTAPPGTPGEYVTVPLAGVPDSMGIAGPIGLGFRVPALVISPFARGGLVASETFDHTSQLRLVEQRFGVEVPNLSDWRRATVGDMTSAFDFATAPNAARPRLPNTGVLATKALLECKVGIDTLLGTFDSTNNPFHYPVPRINVMPKQEASPVRRAPSGPVSSDAVSSDAVSSDAVSSAATGAAAAWSAPDRAPAVPVQAGGKPRSRVAAHADTMRSD
jgi:phospholipase C